VSEQLNGIHKTLQEVISKLLKNKDVKDRVLQWFRLAVGLNQQKQKMYSQVPLCSDGFILNLIDLMLLLCMPYAGKFTEHHLHYPKINTFYLYDDTYIKEATKIEKLDQDVIS